MAASADDQWVAAHLEIEDALGTDLGVDERHRFWFRVQQLLPDARAILGALYPDHDIDVLADRLMLLVAGAIGGRSRRLRALDTDREINPTWFQRSDQVGYVAYADRFGGTLAGVRGRLDHLAALDVTYFHLMHVLRARAGENDGGYAVVDYTDVEPALGTRADLVALAIDLHTRGISLCVDVVMNHTAREHPWAVAARAGSTEHRNRYITFADRTEPDAYERTLPEVFPEIAPGSFTWDDELQAWVWTTFNSFQWDLNYRNPHVFAEMLSAMLTLANLGVDVLRLDAIAFTWKRVGTTCQNQPEAHLIAQLFRAFVGMAAPGVLLKAEAIVGPADLLGYLGAHRTQRRECQLAYHNQLMVDVWDALATGDARLSIAALESLPAAPIDTSWVTYLRCHDDIGWAIDDHVAASVGVHGADHRRHLAAFYRGDVAGSWSDGAAFSSNPEADDERTCGSAAALSGVTHALVAKDAEALDLAVRRLLLGYSVILSFGGIPLIYMGDEIALGNDLGYLDDPRLRTDSRWVHRPRMDWSAVARVGQCGSLEQRVFDALCRRIELRRSTPALAAGGETWIHHLDAPSVLAVARRHQRYGRFYALANFAPAEVSIPALALSWAGLERPLEILGDGATMNDDVVVLAPLAAAWFVDAADAGVDPAPPGVRR